MGERFYYRRMPETHDIVISIDKRLAEARKEIASLEAALTAMSKSAKAASTAAPTASRRANDGATTPSRRANDTATTPSRRANGAAPSRARRPKAAKRGQVVPAGKIEALLRSGDGMSTGELADQASGDRQQVLTLLRELEAAGQVRRSGDRRSTRWHAITDEDRIAARVAELERQSKRASRAA